MGKVTGEKGQDHKRGKSEFLITLWMQEGEIDRRIEVIKSFKSTGSIIPLFPFKGFGSYKSSSLLPPPPCHLTRSR